MAFKQQVFIMESERGWGNKIDEVRYFDTPEQALKFIEDYNTRNNLPEVPDWYMYAEIGSVVWVEEDQESLSSTSE